jgi:hypothetical protein
MISSTTTTTTRRPLCLVRVRAYRKSGLKRDMFRVCVSLSAYHSAPGKPSRPDLDDDITQHITLPLCLVWCGCSQSEAMTSTLRVLPRTHTVVPRNKHATSQLPRSIFSPSHLPSIPSLSLQFSSPQTTHHIKNNNTGPPPPNPPHGPPPLRQDLNQASSLQQNESPRNTLPPRGDRWP